MKTLAEMKSSALAILTKVVDKLSEQSSLSGIASAALLLGVAEPSTMAVAGTIGLIATLLKIILPDTPK